MLGELGEFRNFFGKLSYAPISRKEIRNSPKVPQDIFNFFLIKLKVCLLSVF